MNMNVLAYESPVKNLVLDELVEEPWIQWVVIVGSLAMALAYGVYCRRTGGNYSLTWLWTGLRVTCNR
jgi:hypothetical protein